jgi:hypothetical protein
MLERTADVTIVEVIQHSVSNCTFASRDLYCTRACDLSIGLQLADDMQATYRRYCTKSELFGLCLEEMKRSSLLQHYTIHLSQPSPPLPTP